MLKKLLLISLLPMLVGCNSHKKKDHVAENKAATKQLHDKYDNIKKQIDKITDLKEKAQQEKLMKERQADELAALNTQYLNDHKIVQQQKATQQPQIITHNTHNLPAPNQKTTYKQNNSGIKTYR